MFKKAIKYVEPADSSSFVVKLVCDTADQLMKCEKVLDNFIVKREPGKKSDAPFTSRLVFSNEHRFFVNLQLYNKTSSPTGSDESGSGASEESEEEEGRSRYSPSYRRPEDDPS